MAAPPDLPPPSPDSADRVWHQQALALLDILVRRLDDGGPPERLLHEMLQLMSEWLGLNRGRIVVPAGAARARIVAAYGLGHAERLRAPSAGADADADAVVQHVLHSGQALVLAGEAPQQPQAGLAPPPPAAPGGPALLALPIRDGVRTLGALVCLREDVAARTLHEDMVVLRILATLAGHGLRRLERSDGALAAPPGAPLVRMYMRAASHTPEQLERALAENQGRHLRAARALGLTLRQFNYRLRKARGRGGNNAG